MKLYRAVLKDEVILNSNERAFDKNGNLSSDLNLLDEVYSHIVKSYDCEYAKNRKIVFSFTDDIRVAMKFIENYPQYYDRIACIEVDELGIINNNNLKLIVPVYRIEDWIKMAVLFDSIKDGKIPYHCVNYLNKTFKNLANTLIPSQNGVVSYARDNCEYAVICKDLEPTILSIEEIKNELLSENKILQFNVDNNEKLNEVVDIIVRDLEQLQVKRKDFTINEVEKCKTKKVDI